MFAQIHSADAEEITSWGADALHAGGIKQRRRSLTKLTKRKLKIPPQSNMENSLLSSKLGHLRRRRVELQRTQLRRL